MGARIVERQFCGQSWRNFIPDDRRCQKKDCVPGTWSAWSACSHSCGPRGTQYRRRPIAKPAQRGGKCLVTTIGAKANACKVTTPGKLRRNRMLVVLLSLKKKKAKITLIFPSYAINYASTICKDLVP